MNTIYTGKQSFTWAEFCEISEKEAKDGYIKPSLKDITLDQLRVRSIELTEAEMAEWKRLKTENNDLKSNA